MVRLADYLTIDAVDAQLGASNKPGVIRALVGLLLRVGPDLDPNKVVEVLEQREALQSTGIGRGIGIPHARFPGLKKPMIALGLSTSGIEFDALDGAPTHLFVTVLVPSDAQGLHLKILARVSRLIADKSLLERMITAVDSETLYAAFVEGDDKL